MNNKDTFLKIVVCGAGGRMGGRIIKAIQNTEGVSLTGGVERPDHPLLKKGIANYYGIPELNAPIVSSLDQIIDKAEAIIDFTTPEVSLKHLCVVRDHLKPLVVGTTGFEGTQREEFKRASLEIPICLSPNMSVGVNLIFSIVGQVAKVLGREYEPEIVEVHHKLKKDAPSGTALQIAHILAEARDWDLGQVGVYGRKGLVGVRKSEEIGIHAVRTGDIVGEHTVIFGGPGERIELIHRAHSRDTFAYGAVKAALYVAQARPGLYDMQDVLGLRG